MDPHDTAHRNDAFAGVMMLLRMLLGPLLWPVLIANGMALAWCIREAYQGFAATFL